MRRFVSGFLTRTGDPSLPIGVVRVIDRHRISIQ
jgi:hypothetical protein